MEVVVTAERVADANVEIRVKSDGSGVELSKLKMAMDPFDDVALEEAVRPRELEQAGKVVFALVGAAQAKATLRTALAAGVDRATPVKTDRLAEPIAVADFPQGLVDAEKPGFVILGKQAAHFGLVDDPFTVLPELENAL